MSKKLWKSANVPTPGTYPGPRCENGICAVELLFLSFRFTSTPLYYVNLWEAVNHRVRERRGFSPSTGSRNRPHSVFEWRTAFFFRLFTQTQLLSPPSAPRAGRGAGLPPRPQEPRRARSWHQPAGPTRSPRAAGCGSPVASVNTDAGRLTLRGVSSTLFLSGSNGQLWRQTYR